MNKRNFLIIGILLLVFFYLFSREVKHGYFKQIDFNTTVRLQDKIPARFDQIMDDGAVLADGLVSSAIVLGITAWAFFRWKKKGVWWFAVVIPLGFLVLGLLEIYGKNMLPHPGPPFFMVKHPTTIFPKFTMMEPYSYPSGHAGRITFLAVILSTIVMKLFDKDKNKKMILLAIILGYAVFIYVSRIYLGHHWLSDILGGILVGAASSVAAAGFLL